MTAFVKYALLLIPRTIENDTLNYTVSKMNAEKYFNTRNLYEILQVSPDAEIQEGENLIGIFSYETTVSYSEANDFPIVRSMQ